MSASTTTTWTPQQAGMLAFLLSEVAFFGTLIMTYVYFLRQSVTSSPGPAEVFDMPLVIGATVCLFASSGTVHMAERALHHGWRRGFLAWWSATIALGAAFLAGTAYEWYTLIGHWGLTISRNMFGSCYFTLVGFHATHVTIGVLLMTTLFGLALRGQITRDHAAGVQLVAWYWHFVDAVWVVVFTLVYIVGRQA